MSKISKSGGTVSGDDYEYEKRIAEEEQNKRRAEEEEYNAALEKQKKIDRQQREERDRRIAQERIELMKLKNGVISESETIKEEHQQARQLHGVEKLSNFWYHNKIWILFAAFIIVVVGYITYDTLTREKPDITVMMIADNGLQLRTDELEAFFEKYTDDLNGDGEVHVSVLSLPLNSSTADTMQQGYQSKFLAQLQSSECIMVITDSNTEPDFQEIMKSDLSDDFPGNPYIDEYGLSLNFKFLSEELKFEYMPNDVHLCLRIPIKTVSDSLEEMQESYDTNFRIFSRIVEDLTERAQETNDPGLSTEPVKRDDSNAESVSASE
ncbi:hypothetical protein [Ruminococcus sp. Marseille-P6503]|uniref:hypothetical protein n=1 Tax=Ruminococcus sp. Marseille-P6503 TaxID=2364796 RepID=UPI000F536B8C|nr:hypothetical protein [Ruminococcus sp. Marseille-P6503]